MGGRTEGFAAFDSYLWRIARFTLVQALLSMLLSVALAIPLARALHAHPAFPGRAMILRLFALPLASAGSGRGPRHYQHLRPQWPAGSDFPRARP